MSKRSKAASSRETTPLNWGLLGFSVGTFVEVKNENEEWCPATVTVVQASAERVHVRYSDYPNKPDEWVQVPSDSVRFMSSDAIQKVTISEMKKCGREIQAFKQGDYVYAPWTNGSRHAAKILNVVENSDKDDPGKALYEVRFHDGFLLVVPGKRLRPLDPAVIKKTIFHDEPVLRESRNVFTPESAIQDVEAHSGIRPKKLRMDLKEVFGRPRTSFADSSGSKKRGSGCQRTQPPETKISFPGPTARFSCAPPEASKSRKIAVKANARVTTCGRLDRTVPSRSDFMNWHPEVTETTRDQLNAPTIGHSSATNLMSSYDKPKKSHPSILDQNHAVAVNSASGTNMHPDYCDPSSANIGVSSVQNSEDCDREKNSDVIQPPRMAEGRTRKSSNPRKLKRKFQRTVILTDEICFGSLMDSTNFDERGFTESLTKFDGPVRTAPRSFRTRSVSPNFVYFPEVDFGRQFCDVKKRLHPAAERRYSLSSLRLSESRVTKIAASRENKPKSFANAQDCRRAIAKGSFGENVSSLNKESNHTQGREGGFLCASTKSIETEFTKTILCGSVSPSNADNEMRETPSRLRRAERDFRGDKSISPLARKPGIEDESDDLGAFGEGVEVGSNFVGDTANMEGCDRIHCVGSPSALRDRSQILRILYSEKDGNASSREVPRVRVRTYSPPPPRSPWSALDSPTRENPSCRPVILIRWSSMQKPSQEPDLTLEDLLQLSENTSILSRKERPQRLSPKLIIRRNASGYSSEFSPVKTPFVEKSIKKCSKNMHGSPDRVPKRISNPPSSPTKRKLQKPCVLDAKEIRSTGSDLRSVTKLLEYHPIVRHSLLDVETSHTCENFHENPEKSPRVKLASISGHSNGESSFWKLDNCCREREISLETSEMPANPRDVSSDNQPLILKLKRPRKDSNGSRNLDGSSVDPSSSKTNTCIQQRPKKKKKKRKKPLHEELYSPALKDSRKSPNIEKEPVFAELKNVPLYDLQNDAEYSPELHEVFTEHDSHQSKKRKIDAFLDEPVNSPSCTSVEDQPVFRSALEILAEIAASGNTAVTLNEVPDCELQCVEITRPHEPISKANLGPDSVSSTQVVPKEDEEEENVAIPSSPFKMKLAVNNDKVWKVEYNSMSPKKSKRKKKRRRVKNKYSQKANRLSSVVTEQKSNCSERDSLGDANSDVVAPATTQNEEEDVLDLRMNDFKQKTSTCAENSCLNDISESSAENVNEVSVGDNETALIVGGISEPAESRREGIGAVEANALVPEGNVKGPSVLDAIPSFEEKAQELTTYSEVPEVHSQPCQDILKENSNFEPERGEANVEELFCQGSNTDHLAGASPRNVILPELPLDLTIIAHTSPCRSNLIDTSETSCSRMDVTENVAEKYENRGARNSPKYAVEAPNHFQEFEATDFLDGMTAWGTFAKVPNSSFNLPNVPGSHAAYSLRDEVLPDRGIRRMCHSEPITRNPDHEERCHSWSETASNLSTPPAAHLSDELQTEENFFPTVDSCDDDKLEDHQFAETMGCHTLVPDDGCWTPFDDISLIAAGKGPAGEKNIFQKPLPGFEVFSSTPSRRPDEEVPVSKDIARVGQILQTFDDRSNQNLSDDAVGVDSTLNGKVLPGFKFVFGLTSEKFSGFEAGESSDAVSDDSRSRCTQLNAGSSGNHEDKEPPSPKAKSPCLDRVENSVECSEQRRYSVERNLQGSDLSLKNSDTRENCVSESSDEKISDFPDDRILPEEEYEKNYRTNDGGVNEEGNRSDDDLAEESSFDDRAPQVTDNHVPSADFSTTYPSTPRCKIEDEGSCSEILANENQVTHELEEINEKKIERSWPRPLKSPSLVSDDSLEPFDRWPESPDVAENLDSSDDCEIISENIIEKCSQYKSPPRKATRRKRIRIPRIKFIEFKTQAQKLESPQFDAQVRVPENLSQNLKPDGGEIFVGVMREAEESILNCGSANSDASDQLLKVVKQPVKFRCGRCDHRFENEDECRAHLLSYQEKVFLAQIEYLNTRKAALRPSSPLCSSTSASSAFSSPKSCALESPKGPVPEEELDIFAEFEAGTETLDGISSKETDEKSPDGFPDTHLIEEDHFAPAPILKEERASGKLNEVSEVLRLNKEDFVEQQILMEAMSNHVEDKEAVSENEPWDVHLSVTCVNSSTVEDVVDGSDDETSSFAFPDFLYDVVASEEVIVDLGPSDFSPSANEDVICENKDESSIHDSDEACDPSTIASPCEDKTPPMSRGFVCCFCGSDAETEPMVQCRTCFMKQHVKCEGYSDLESVPESHICTFCRNPHKLRPKVNFGAEDDLLSQIDFAPRFLEKSLSTEVAEQHRGATNDLKVSVATANMLHYDLDKRIRSIDRKIQILEGGDENVLSNWANLRVPLHNIKDPQLLQLMQLDSHEVLMNSSQGFRNGTTDSFDLKAKIGKDENGMEDDRKAFIERCKRNILAEIFEEDDVRIQLDYQARSELGKIDARLQNEPNLHPELRKSLKEFCVLMGRKLDILDRNAL